MNPEGNNPFPLQNHSPCSRSEKLHQCFLGGEPWKLRGTCVRRCSCVQRRTLSLRGNPCIPPGAKWATPENGMSGMVTGSPTFPCAPLWLLCVHARAWGKEGTSDISLLRRASNSMRKIQRGSNLPFLPRSTARKPSPRARGTQEPGQPLGISRTQTVSGSSTCNSAAHTGKRASSWWPRAFPTVT